jgi:hypothetical protein
MQSALCVFTTTDLITEYCCITKVHALPDCVSSSKLKRLPNQSIPYAGWPIRDLTNTFISGRNKKVICNNSVGGPTLFRLVPNNEAPSLQTTVHVSRHAQSLALFSGVAPGEI